MCACVRFAGSLADVSTVDQPHTQQRSRIDQNYNYLTVVIAISLYTHCVGPAVGISSWN
jgi:hypothetical protein